MVSAMNILSVFAKIEYYVLLVLIFIAILSGLVFFLSRKKILTEDGFDTEYLNLIYIALGGSENIITVVLEHQRLQIKVVNMKNVNGVKLRELRIPAFVKGKYITILIKKHTQEVLSYIEDRKKEDN